MTAIDYLVAKAVGAQHRAGVNDRARSDAGVVVEDRAWKNRNLLADATTGHDVGAGVYCRKSSNFHIVSNGGAWMNHRVRCDARRGAHNRPGANSADRSRMSWAEIANNFG